MSDDRQDDRPERAPSERASLIESRMNIERASLIEAGPGGGLATKDLAQIYEFAKGMALSGPLVPAFLRERPWSCVGVIMQALEWRMSPFSVARQAYEVENRRTGERTVAYMSQMLHAVLEARAPLKERLRVRYEGEGDDTVCVVTGTFKGEEEPREWRSPKLGERRPQPQKRTDRRTGEEYETVSGSPLWQTKPLVQLFYDTSRDWGRIYAPDIVMGIYGKDEMEESGYVDVTPSAPREDDGGLSKRLTESALMRAGFSVEHAMSALGEPVDRDEARADNQPSRASVENPHSPTPSEGAPTAQPLEAPPPASDQQDTPRRASRRPRRRAEGEEGQPDQPGLV